ncbi:hypothetical protein VP01_1877g3 [Puccinia sorghi]|uniref:Uncharacterized protein n=1 Tax=Puccinia sorghi TaxID=27349 RepID=A0A0L6VD28_9BASI|nr:hypothetical protein VP01_1877g3 [Puccinia sorghi]
MLRSPRNAINSTQNKLCCLQNQLNDALWGNDPKHRTSQSGYLCYLFGSLVSWNSSQQHNITYSLTEAGLNPLVDSFHEGTWLKALLSDIWNIQLDAANHYIDDGELNECLFMDEEEFEEKFNNKHYIDNKGLDNKLKKFRSNAKTRHIDLKTKGMRQEFKSKNIKIILIRTFDIQDHQSRVSSLEDKISPVTRSVKIIFYLCHIPFTVSLWERRNLCVRTNTTTMDSEGEKGEGTYLDRREGISAV